MADDLLPAEPRRTAALDWAHLARQTAGDAELEAELLALFERQAQDMARKLAAPAADEDRRDLVHMLKGSAAAIGAVRLARAAERCEAALASGAGAENAGLRELDDLLAEAVEAISVRLRPK
jgi:HPt (histidine-containing phosphotransfer) domain-containing protein